MNLDKLIRPNIRSLVPYSSARDEYSGTDVIQLDANENAFASDLARYPDPYQKKLKQAIAKKRKMSIDQLILGNGSDEIIDLLIRTFCEPKKDNVISLKPSYGMYKVCCDINNVQYREVPLNADFELNAVDVLKAVDDNSKLIFLCSPNNPSGNLLNNKEVTQILNNFNGIVIVDEAYIDYADAASWIKELETYPNLFVLQTFSKSFGLAGIRIGMGWGSPELIQVLNKVKPPYNINSLSQVEALRIVEKEELLVRTLESTKLNKTALQNELGELEIVEKVFPSDANFFLVRFKSAQKVYDFLKDNDVVVRNRSRQFNCENCLRITIGTEKENQELLKYLKLFQNEESSVY